MGFDRTNEFEHFVGETKSTLEDSLSEELARVHDKQPSLAEYIQSSLAGSMKATAHPQGARTTVAEMVKDLISRTGLQEYVKSVEAEANAAGQSKKAYPQMSSTTPSENDRKGEKKDDASDNNQEISLLDAPHFKEDLLNHIKSLRSHQPEAVMDWVRKEKASMPAEFSDIDPNMDPKLIKFIKDNVEKAPEPTREPPTAQSSSQVIEETPAWASEKKGQE